MTAALLETRSTDAENRVGDVSDDGKLLAAIAERRPGAFEALVSAYSDRLYGLAWRVTQSREDAEEAAQDALVKAHRALFQTYSVARLRELSLRAWLYRVTLNAARNRRRVHRPSSSLDQEQPGGRLGEKLIAKDRGPLAIAENSELGVALEAALGDLPARYRAAVVLRSVEGLSYLEASQALGRPVGTVKSDVHRGLRLLKQSVGPLLEAE